MASSIAPTLHDRIRTALQEAPEVPPVASPDPAPLPPEWADTNAQVQTILRSNLLFVIGCQRSGTTWLQRLLNEHPDILCKGETRLFPVLLPVLRDALAHYNQQQRVGTDAQITDRQLEYLFATSIALMFGNMLGNQQVKWIGETTPEHALIAPLLAKLLPQAKFIHIIRDGRDAAISGWLLNLATTGEAYKEQHPDLASYIEHFVRDHWVPYISNMRSVGRAAPDRYFELRYEELHTDPDAVIGRLFAFLEVDASDHLVAYCRSATTFERLSGGRARGQEDTGAMFRKGVIGDWKNHFDDRCTEAFMAHGGALLGELGYEKR